ncbi:MerC domain-containing protein [Rhodohalobacter sp. 614A]|uniref:MerC domain-containing protein n=1 Tax=Rhodohalobacter sp. 614A TaxID=2908649 RepID=UPI001F39CA05|nr:MerC domain-containing protein [Rhodohalobacter sp. 614A]
MSDKRLTASLFWDKLGIGISGACAIHCLLLPVIVAVLPLWGFASILHDWLHPIFILLIAPTIYFASKRSHFDRKITGTLTSGFLLILIGWVAGHFWIGLWFETTLTVLGSAVLITGHWFNYRHHQLCDIEKHNHHPDISDIEEEKHHYHEAS